MSCTITPLPFVNTIVSRHPMREEVSTHSSGTFYDTPHKWYAKIARVVSDYDYQVGELPPLYVGFDEQLDAFYLPLEKLDGTQVGGIRVAIYRTPRGSYEIVAYVV